ncbi:hypothetical protein BC940DRAFT_297974 [Gongronella butleri]|nr:hypothetical protein BC940DRAFT_303309 [Gongronella butleri]KAI8069534.1 hypothetical protein BC940DRAFT_297974 [Gongronella butleri]
MMDTPPAPSKNKPYDDDISDDEDGKPGKRSGRRKIKIEYIEDKNRRHITFSKRKAGIMKKCLLLVVSETGLVYTFTTVKLQPIVTKPEGKNLIQACLNAPDPSSGEPTNGYPSYPYPSQQPSHQAAQPYGMPYYGHQPNQQYMPPTSAAQGHPYPRHDK